jgi:hypothetical protein
MRTSDEDVEQAVDQDKEDGDRSHYDLQHELLSSVTAPGEAKS